MTADQKDMHTIHSDNTVSYSEGNDRQSNTGLTGHRRQSQAIIKETRSHPITRRDYPMMDRSYDLRENEIS